MINVLGSEQLPTVISYRHPCGKKPSKICISQQILMIFLQQLIDIDIYLVHFHGVTSITYRVIAYAGGNRLLAVIAYFLVICSPTNQSIFISFTGSTVPDSPRHEFHLVYVKELFNSADFYE